MCLEFLFSRFFPPTGNSLGVTKISLNTLGRVTDIQQNGIRPKRNHVETIAEEGVASDQTGAYQWIIGTICVT